MDAEDFEGLLQEAIESGHVAVGIELVRRFADAGIEGRAPGLEVRFADGSIIHLVISQKQYAATGAAKH